jgi:hypothetical protein
MAKRADRAPARKRGLCVGINDYPGTANDLRGCVNDANDWAKVLVARGFQVAKLLDRDATRKNMLDALRSLISGASSGDTIVFQYSGHGTWVPDRNGDEPDFRDEAYCPYDIGSKGPLLDDDLYDLFASRKSGVRCITISDSCHSGTNVRMAPSMNGSTARVRFLPYQAWSGKKPRSVVRGRASTPGRSSSLLLAGCQDTEYSYDARIGGRNNGAFTSAALKALAGLKQKDTYTTWMQAIRRALPSQDYPQTPNLFGTRAQRRWSVLA